MSRMRRFEIVEHSPSYFVEKTSIFNPPTKSLTLNTYFPIVEDDFNLLSFPPTPPISFFDEFDTITDLIQIDQTPTRTSTRRVTRRVGLGSDLYLQTLCDRVSALEFNYERVLREEEEEEKKKKKRKEKNGDRKYTWTAEIKSPENDRKYKWTAEIKNGEKKSCKWTADIKGKGGKDSPVERRYTIKVSNGDSGSEDEKKKKKKSENGKGKGKSVGPTARVIQIEEPSDHGAVVLRQAFAKRVEKRKGKKKELSPQDAATLIQMSFRAYLIRRSQALRALRELAIAKNKLKEIRALFNNFTYRRRLSRDAEERQKFTEKLIVLLLTVDAIEGADLMVRAAKKSMVDELEAMLDVVDPQPPGKSLSRRRTFDMPDGVMNKELAAGVAQVVRMLDEEATGSETFEASLSCRRPGLNPRPSRFAGLGTSGEGFGTGKCGVGG
ncbi:hypothetical protein RD792_013692 [Penstemon davidsonii]|uniref:BAG domain-containing protein n=1 Tax=Penstemon davidsonii TaxID=160366 RepID=A0ABR0CV34_9LAMI|nr:hypothetical protein RD792_013692 [Penstemon davidsonii]